MKRRLTKILFISLLFSAAVPSTMQAGFFSLPTLKKIGSKTLNLLTTNGGGDIFSFLKRHKIAVGAGAVFVVLWNLKGIILNKVMQKANRVMQESLIEELNRQQKLDRQRRLNNDLTKAIKNNNIDDVREALLLGADANNKNEQGNKPLILATREGHLKTREGYLEIVKLLLKHKADINGQDYFGKTPLIKAAASNHSKVIELLLANGADPTMKDRFGSTALMEAKHHHNSEAVKSLEGF